ncbi:Ribonuclease H-like superfamily [Sesbania bispinosa]|nr:Ribonuclease H-like superfamily [Sesbania bispinosa]
MKVHQVTIKKGRKITTYIYSRTMLISMLKKFTKGKDLIRPGITRFATAFLTLGCLNDNKASLMSLFSSNDWKSSKFASTQEGRRVQSMALDSRLWKKIIICLKAAAPLMTVLRLLDSDGKPAMGFIYKGMDCAKEKIKSNFNNVNKRIISVKLGNESVHNHVVVDDDDNVEQVEVEGSSNPTVDDLENLVFDENIEEPLST